MSRQRRTRPAPRREAFHDPGDGDKWSLILGALAVLAGFLGPPNRN